MTKARQPIQLPARKIAIVAQAEFTAMAAEKGRRAALKTFNRRVSHWANQFGDKRLRRFAYTLGTMMDGETHSFAIPIYKFRRKHWKLHPDAYVNASTGRRRMLDERTIRRYLEAMEKAGVITVTRDRRQDETGEYPGMRKANVYTVHFHLVIRHGETCVHDFTSADQRKPSENVRKLAAKDAVKPAAKDVPVSGSSTGSNSGSSSASSSSGPGEPVPSEEHDDEPAAGKDLSRVGESAPVGGGAAGQDHPLAESRPAGKGSASAAPPVGGAPAATTGSASGAKRDNSKASGRRKDRGPDEFDEIARKLAKLAVPEFDVSLLASRLRDVARVAGISADTTEDALCWWLWGYAPDTFRHLDDEDEDGNKIVPDPGSYIHDILPDLIQAYLDARNATAREVGENPDEFSLSDWLDDPDFGKYPDRWAAKEIEDINEHLAELLQPQINGKKLNLQLIHMAREHSPATVTEAVWWWLNGYSQHKHPVEMDNAAGFLSGCLAGIVRDYVVARERQARELGLEDRDGFNLNGWLIEQKEQDRAEREAQAAQEKQDRAEREAEEQRDPEEQKAELIDIITELAELRNIPRKQFAREVGNTYVDKYHANQSLTIIHYRRELQEAKEMAAA